MWHSGKGKTIVVVKKLAVATSEWGHENESAEHGELFRVKKLFFTMTAIMMDTCHYTCV